MLCPRYLTAAIMTCPPELLWSCDSSSTSGSGTVLGLTYLILTLLPYSYSHPHSSSFGSLLILPTSNLQPLTLQPPTSYLLPLTSYLQPPTSNLPPLLPSPLPDFSNPPALFTSPTSSLSFSQPIQSFILILQRRWTCSTSWESCYLCSLRSGISTSRPLRASCIVHRASCIYQSQSFTYTLILYT